MATTDNATPYDSFFIRDTYKYYPNKTDLVTLLELAKVGVIQRDRFVEFCMANASKGKYTQKSEQGYDFCDFSDCKTVTIQYRKKKNKETPIISVKNVNRKKGALRVVAFDPKLEIMRYFFIWALPQKILSFTLNDNCKYINGHSGIEVDCFSELAQYSRETPPTPHK